MPIHNTVDTRSDLIQYCLRELGKPVLEINVDSSQMEDCVDYALQTYQEFHDDATRKLYFKYQISDSDLSNGYIDMSPDVLYVTRMFSPTATWNQTGNFFDIRYQLALNQVADLNTWAGDLAYYFQLQQYLELLEDVLAGEPIIDFARRQNRLYIRSDLNDGDLRSGDYIIAEAYTIVDSADGTPNVWDDMFMKDYTTALIKRRWGNNMKKFEGIQLPGGVTMNGQKMFDEATEEMRMLRERMRLEHEAPPPFIVG